LRYGFKICDLSFEIFHFMRKNVFGRKLQRDINERKALFKSLMRELIVRGRIHTTQAKAKAIKADIDKAITKAKKNPELAKQKLQANFAMPVLRKLVDEIAPRFSARQGGYTRIITMGNRLRDNAKMVMMEWTEKNVKSKEVVTADKVELSEEDSNKPEIIDAEILEAESKTKVKKTKAKKK